jgi:hypothetical protein
MEERSHLSPYLCMILRVSLLVAKKCCSFSNVWASSICDVVPALVLCMYVVLFMPPGRLASMCIVKRKALLLVYCIREIGESMVAVFKCHMTNFVCKYERTFKMMTF